MSEDKVVPFHQKDEIDDPLIEILRAGAKRLIEQAVEAEFSRPSWARTPISSYRTVASASFVTDMIRFVRSRRALGRSKWRSPRRVIVAF